MAVPYSVLAGVPRLYRLILPLLLLMTMLGTRVLSQQVVQIQPYHEINYCSFFNNRAPKAQPGLQNCTWFKEHSCCLQQEISATFGRVKPLKGASPGCQKYINYLMCYICAPNQNVFYQKERLTVCEDFCNHLYDACRNAILKGSIIGELYESGAEFCRSRRFLVSNKSCFHFDTSFDTSGVDASTHISCYINLYFIIYLLCVNFL